MVTTEFPAQGTQESAFLESALTKDGVMLLDEFSEWFAARGRANSFEVKKKPLSMLQGWQFEPETANLVHKSGKFFCIEGISVETNFGPTPAWMQPIINQPEVGILGFLVKKINGIMHFLVQAKMEPGNVNLIQLSPTVQATRSNYTQVHGGQKPRYLEYFMNHARTKILVNQLQSEQGARFLRKRNCNVIVEVDAAERVEVYDDYCWLTLGQLLELLKRDNVVNMDSRTVLSCIRFSGKRLSTKRHHPKLGAGDFDESVLISSLAEERLATNDFDDIVSWLTGLKIRYELKVRRIPLSRVENWTIGDEIRHSSGRFFKVIGVSVTASNREVGSWEQPLIESEKGGIICFICQQKNGVLHFLVQGRVEPGNFDCVEMSPTVQCTPANHDSRERLEQPPFFDLVARADTGQIRFDTVQSEEGGRFYHDQNRYMVLEITEQTNLDLPDNYIWMTVRQIKEFIRFNNYLNIEARGLLSCLGVAL